MPRTDTFLNSDELRELTGRARKSAQVEQLGRMGIRHFTDALGRPVVPRSALDGVAANDTTGHSVQPDWGKLR